MKKSSQVEILELTLPHASKALKDADAWLEMLSKPEELARAVNSLQSHPGESGHNPRPRLSGSHAGCGSAKRIPESQLLKI
jgi:hypothetical protein